MHAVYRFQNRKSLVLETLLQLMLMLCFYFYAIVKFQACRYFTNLLKVLTTSLD